MKTIPLKLSKTNLLFMRKKNLTRVAACMFAMFISIALSAQQVTKTFNNQTLKEVLKEVETQTGLSVIYLTKDVNENKPVTASFQNAPLSQVMSKVLDHNLKYEIQSNILIIAKQNESIQKVLQANQSKAVRGQIVDAKGEPIIGATVAVKGTSKGTTTDYNGNYVLENISEKDVISVSYIGYEPMEFPANSKNLAKITLKEDTKLLDEVVVIGYGSTRKEDLSTAVSTMKLDNRIKSRPSNLTSVMQGEIPGVTIQASSGDPMADVTSSINIRGRGSRANDRVLYVVDGVPNAPFNVEDIESISVLKDAASAAIYGASVGSGGVIVITTKQAKDGKIKIDFNISRGFKTAKHLPEVLTAEQFNKVTSDALSAAGKPIISIVDPSLYAYGNTTRTDWINEIFRTAPLEHYALSLSGGSSTLKALASISYDKEGGVLLNTHSNQLGAKTDISFQLTDWLRLGERATFQYSNGQGGVNTTSHEGVLMSAIFYPRSATIYEYSQDGIQVLDEFGNPVFGGTIPAYWAKQGMSGYGEIRNPVATLLRLRQNRPSSRIYSTTTLEIKPLRNLTLKSDFTAGLNSARYEDFNPRVLEIGRTDADNSRKITNTWNTNWLWETIASYSNLFADKHHVSAMGGFTMGYENYRYNSGAVHGFSRENEHYTIWNNGTDFIKTKSYEEIWDEATTSVFGRLSYSFDDRYFLTASLRRDASSKLWKDNNYGIFPAFSASWKISSEPFFASLRPTINLLKVRGSWGQIGNNNLVPRYSYNVPMGRAPWQAYYGKDLQTEARGVYQTSISNKKLKWETTEQTGIGLDIALLNNRFSFSADYFHKLTKDLIERIPITPTAGIETEPYGNIGKVLNKGWEFSAKYNQSFNKIDFNIFANLSTVYNEVLDLGNREYYPHDMHVNNMFQPLRSVVGQPWYSYYLLKTDGIFQSTEEIENYLHTDKETGAKKIIQPNARPGDFKFVDTNNDGIINDKDRQYMGSYLPKITYGFGTSLSGYGFDFSMFFQGVSGIKIYNGLKQMSLSGRGGNTGYNMLSDILKSWNYDKTSGYPRLEISQPSNQKVQDNLKVGSDFFLEDGSYLRLRNITLGYTLPKSLMNSMGIPSSSLRFYVSGENIVTFTKYSGIAPEVGNYGIDNGTYPIASSWSFGLNFNF